MADLNKFDSKLGMTPNQWMDLIKRLNDPLDPAGNYRTPGGGGTFDVNRMKKVKKKTKKKTRVA